MSHEFQLASGNAHKAEEFNVLFDSSIVNLFPAPEKLEIVEDGMTYSENALKKARGYFEKFQKPVMSDDSGLEVMALPGELGIHTARYGGDGLSASERNELLLKNLQEQVGEHRAAEFVCVLCFYFSESEYYFFEGRLKGTISSLQQGKDGFGYDPLFLPEGAEAGKTLAELPEWKDKNSHRAVACREASKFFKERNGQN